MVSIGLSFLMQSLWWALLWFMACKAYGMWALLETCKVYGGHY